MYCCYVDESGDTGALPAAALIADNQPVLVLGGLFLDLARLEDLTHDFLHLKYRYFPGLPYPSALHLDRIIPEIKGAELRKDATRRTVQERRQVFGFLDKVFDLLEKYDARLVARIWVKGLAQPFKGRHVYTSSVQAICTYFQAFLDDRDSFGVVLADSRTPALNVSVAHSIFTQKFQLTTQRYDRIAELPTFGHSDNHAGLQLCDILCSALLCPIACYAYCSGHVANLHVQPTAELLRDRYGERLKSLQFRYKEPNAKHLGGVVVGDAIAGQSGSRMFR